MFWLTDAALTPRERAAEASVPDSTTQVKLVIAPIIFTEFPNSIHKFFLVKTQAAGLFFRPALDDNLSYLLHLR